MQWCPSLWLKLTLGEKLLRWTARPTSVRRIPACSHPLMLPIVCYRAAEGVFREDDREGHAVPPRLPQALRRIGGERTRSGRRRVKMECADQVVTHDQCTCARSQVPFFGRALLRIAFDHDDA